MSPLRRGFLKERKDDILNGRFLVCKLTIATEISNLKRFQKQITLFIKQVKETVGHSGLGIILNNTPHFFYNKNFPIPPPTSIPPFFLPAYQLSVPNKPPPLFWNPSFSSQVAGTRETNLPNKYRKILTFKNIEFSRENLFREKWVLLSKRNLDTQNIFLFL